MANNLLIVEGLSDKNFIQAFLDYEGLDINLDVRVVTAPEIDADIRHTTKQGIFRAVETLIKQLNDGRYTRIGILIDMDYQEDSRLPIKKQNLNQLSAALNPHGFSLKPQASDDKGLYFDNPDFDNPIGIWIMPNNDSEGYLESWIKSCIQDKKANHFQHAEAFVDSLGTTHFKASAITKAKIYTWLAIQPKPTQDLSRCLLPKYNLLDTSSSNYKNFREWLITTFM